MFTPYPTLNIDTGLKVNRMNWHIRYAAHVIREGGIIAYPTEGVWGLGCDPWHSGAVERLLRLKSRPMHKGLIVVTGQRDQLTPLLEQLSHPHLHQLDSTWPGPVTWVIDDTKNWMPEWIKGHFPSVAVRVSDHALVSKLSEQLGHPLVSTSANPAGHPPAKNSLQVRQYFSNALDYILPGQLGIRQQPSEIRVLGSGKRLRV